MYIKQVRSPILTIGSVISRRKLFYTGLILGHSFAANFRPSVAKPTWLSSPKTSRYPLFARAESISSSPMADQNHLVNELVEEGVIQHDEVEKAMRAVDRRYFSGKVVSKHYAYSDTPLPIGYGETISAPHMHASCLEMLHEHLKPGARVLDVGSGSGILSVAMALMVGPQGRVIGIEKHPELTEDSIENVKQFMPDLLTSGRVVLRTGNVLGNALDNEEPFDAIHVGAAAEQLPDVLVKKLNPGGRMVIPIGPHGEFQVMQMIDKDATGHIHKKNLMYVRYVPLTEPGNDEL